uniref:Tetratricopeptide repeat protein 5 OB fold domain-containing protein n=1 Tax=Strigamia maritima TaxID=126957 RepID=T1J2A1_STRMM
MAAKSIETNTPLEKAQALVDRLYTLKNNYFDDHDISEAAKKNENVSLLLQKTLDELEVIKDQCETENKAKYLLLRGKALNVLSHFNEDALHDLEKAVKLDPKLVEAWNELGECYWKKGDMESAKNCFNGALSKEKDKISLRQLSMVLRQLKVNEKDRVKTIEDSVSKAKEAVLLDANDGLSWCILGNAYLTLFFTSSQNPKLLKQAMISYSHADKDKNTVNNPDLHYNRAIIWKYEEEYQKALEGFARASALDPLWSTSEEKEVALLQYLLKVQSLILNKGQLKTRRLQPMIQSLNESQLGPYRGGSYTSSGGKSVELKLVDFDDLKEGINLNKVVYGKVICNVVGEEPVPFTFCLIDKKSVCWSVTIYNIAQGKGVIIGDSVAIPEPFVQQIKVNYKEKDINYWNIRVDTPLVLVVNGKKLQIDKQAMTEIAVSIVNN